MSRTVCCANQKMWVHAEHFVPANFRRGNNLPVTVTNAVLQAAAVSERVWVGCAHGDIDLDKLMKIIFMNTRSAAEI